MTTLMQEISLRTAELVLSGAFDPSRGTYGVLHLTREDMKRLSEEMGLTFKKGRKGKLKTAMLIYNIYATDGSISRVCDHKGTCLNIH